MRNMIKEETISKHWKRITTIVAIFTFSLGRVSRSDLKSLTEESKFPSSEEIFYHSQKISPLSNQIDRAIPQQISTIPVQAATPEIFAIPDQAVIPKTSAIRDQVATPQKEERRSLIKQISSKAAVVTLITNDQSDVDDLCVALKSLVFLRGGYGGSLLRGGPSGVFASSTVLVFNEGNLLDQQITQLKKCTSRSLKFPVVDLARFPPGFDPEAEWERYAHWTTFRPRKGRNGWSYAQMLWFWTSGVWEQPVTSSFETVMKMDSDSCFLLQTGNTLNSLYQELPGLSDQYVYQTNYDEGVGGDKTFVEGLWDFAKGYMEREGMEGPANLELWEYAKGIWETTGNLPMFGAHMEVVRVNFFLRDDVSKFLRALTDEEPFGVYTKRWSVAHTRLLTLAMFAEKETILLSKSVGYMHGLDRCKKKNHIEKAHDSYATPERW